MTKTQKQHVELLIARPVLCQTTPIAVASVQMEGRDGSARGFLKKTTMHPVETRFDAGNRVLEVATVLVRDLEDCRRTINDSITVIGTETWLVYRNESLCSFYP